VLFPEVKFNGTGEVNGGVPVKKQWRIISAFLAIVALGLALCACGGSPTRYDPGAPSSPAGLAAVAGNGQVSLTWSAATNAASYAIYYSTSPGVTRSSGTKFADTTSTSAIVTGLTNNTTYYFVVTSVNSTSESAESNEVSATPVLPPSFSQSDLTGDWNFNILVTGASDRWMRGRLSIDGSGTVSFTSFQDSSGGTTPPADLFPALYLDSGGTVRDAATGTAVFRGVMASRLNMVVGTAFTGSASPLIAILQKQVSGVTFSDNDLKGFGNAGGGARRFVYNQISTGSVQEWEYAVGQIGSDQTVQYTTFTAPSNPATPGKKASKLSITGDGIVTESLTGASPRPSVVMDRGVMSADKSVIVATATDTSGATPKRVLRIYQMINITTNDGNSLTLADLKGGYAYNALAAGSGPLSAYGSLQIDGSGVTTFSSYLDSAGSSALPAGFTLAVDTVDTLTGILANAADSTFHGKLSYYKDMLVFTRTESNGSHGVYIGLK
jgi:hypothetical protein